MEELDGQSLEAFLLVDGVPKGANHRIDRVGGCSLERVHYVATNGDLGSRLSFTVEDPVYEIDKLNEALAYNVVVEFDEAAFNVFGPVGDDIGLVGHRKESDVVDREQERVIGHVVEDLDFPLELFVPQRNGKSAWCGEFLAIEIEQNV